MRDAMSAGMSPQEELKQAQKNLKQAQARVLAEEAVKRRNKKFKALSAAGKRVAIATDVLKQLASGRYIADSIYLRVTNCGSLDGSEQLQDVIANDQVRCEVCGIGSLMVSACSFADKLTFRQADNADWVAVQKYLSTWFSTDQLDLVERWFESCRAGGKVREELHQTATPDDAHPIIKKLSAHDRLRAIMVNIVSNRGTFDPTKGKHGRKAAK